MPSSAILRFDGTLVKDPSIAAWMETLAPELRMLAEKWFPVMRECGDEVLELFHDGWAVACFGDAPFAYVGAYRAHVNVGFFQGATLPDPQRLLQGSGKYMRHIQLRPGEQVKEAALISLIEAAFLDMKSRVENA